MPNIKPRPKDPLFWEMKSSVIAKTEQADCTVIALAVMADISYSKAHQCMEAAGRTHGKPAWVSQMKRCLSSLGFTATKVHTFEMINQYPKAHQVLRTITTHHPDRFPKAWKDGTYLLVCKGHVAAVKDGVLVDWTRGRKFTVRRIYKVEKE